MSDATVNSHGTKVEVRAPTHRSLCFNLWLMYCRILKERAEDPIKKGLNKGEEQQRQPDWKQTRTCPSPGFRHCIGYPSTCPRTRRLWAVCMDQTHLQSCQPAVENVNNEKRAHASMIVPISQTGESTLGLLPLLEDHEVGKTCENWSQNTGVLQKLLETKRPKITFLCLIFFFFIV